MRRGREQESEEPPLAQEPAPYAPVQTLLPQQVQALGAPPHTQIQRETTLLPGEGGSAAWWILQLCSHNGDTKALFDVVIGWYRSKCIETL